MEKRVVGGIECYTQKGILDLGRSLGVPERVLNKIKENDKHCHYPSFPITLDYYRPSFTTEMLWKYRIVEQDGKVTLYPEYYERGNCSVDWGRMGSDDKIKTAEDIPQLLADGYIFNLRRWV